MTRREDANNEPKMHGVLISIPTAASRAPLSRGTALKLILAIGGLCLATISLAQDGSRWFQIEVSIFSNEAPADRGKERWQADRTRLTYPKNLRQLDQLSELLLLEELKFPIDNAPGDDVTAVIEELTPQQIDRELILAMGPQPFRTAPANKPFRFYDLDRDSYLQLPPSASDFRQTNRALERSPAHRLLFHGLWRQPVVGQADAIPLYISGGLQYGDQHELQGSITIRFNENADRVVVDVNLWLAEFSIVPDSKNDWNLPPVPADAGIRTEAQQPDNSALDYSVTRVFQFKQSRDMRSTEFHYLDHPAMGLVIMVEPYELPPVPVSRFDASRDP